MSVRSSVLALILVVCAGLLSPSVRLISAATHRLPVEAAVVQVALLEKQPAPGMADQRQGLAGERQTAAQPMTTGSPSGKMDAGEQDAQMEAYRHSKTVAGLARLLHVSVERAAQIFEDLNSGILILVVLYFLVKYLPRQFQSRRAKIEHELVDARSATQIASERLKAVEARLAGLDREIEQIRQQARMGSEADHQRIEASLETERSRIVRSAEQEIGALQAAAQRELKRFAAELAIERAMSRIELSVDQDRALVNEFTENLGAVLHPGEFKKRERN